MADLDYRVVDTLTTLIQALKASERRLYSAAEHIRNRGLKLVLKSYVQQRVRAAHDLWQMTPTADALTEERVAANLFSRGWTDVKATMTVKRQGRQALVLQEVAQEEADLLNHYSEALKQLLPDGLQELIRRQYQELRLIHRRLMQLAADADQRVLVRLFNNGARAEAVLQHLQQAGFAADDLYTTTVDDLAVYADNAKAKRRSLRDTVLTVLMLGALLGAGLGLLLGVGHRLYFPEVPGVFSTTPAGVMMELIVGGALIGALFGTIFGFLMGRDAVEDDAYLYTESLQDGDTLVAVFTDRAKAAEAERLIGLRHQFEVEPVAT
jgi:uncharacterized protein (TIGR02284 family)